MMNRYHSIAAIVVLLFFTFGCEDKFHSNENKNIVVESSSRFEILEEFTGPNGIEMKFIRDKSNTCYLYTNSYIYSNYTISIVPCNKADPKLRDIFQ